MRNLLLALVALVSVAACASKIPPECRTEYAHTIMHCAREPPPRPPTPEECKKMGGVQVYVNGDYKGCADRATLFRNF